MEMEPELAQRWIESADRLQATLERFHQRRAADGMPGINTQAGNIVVRVEDNKTPRMVTIAVCCAVLCAVLSSIAIPSLFVLYLNVKDHLDAIYMVAPQLQTETPAHVDHHPDPAAQEAGRLDHRAGR